MIRSLGSYTVHSTTYYCIQGKVKLNGGEGGVTCSKQTIPPAHLFMAQIEVMIFLTLPPFLMYIERFIYYTFYFQPLRNM